MGSFYDQDGGEIQWKFFHLLHNLQDDQRLNLGNKFSAQQLEYQKHKMNVRLAAQTLAALISCKCNPISGCFNEANAVPK